MEIRGYDLIEIFCKKHADALEPLEQWVRIVEAAQWKMHSDLKADFSSADYVGKRRYVFDIKGNHHRIIGLVIFFEGAVDIRFIGTHAEYTKLNKTKDITTL